MSPLLNLIWLALAGLWLFVSYCILGLGFCLTIIGIPMGLVSLKLGVQMLMPFGKRVYPKPHATGALRLVLAVLWVVIGPGPGLCLMHLLTGLLLCVTVIGIPLGLQNFKLMQVALLPLHYELR